MAKNNSNSHNRSNPLKRTNSQIGIARSDDRGFRDLASADLGALARLLAVLDFDEPLILPSL